MKAGVVWKGVEVWGGRDRKKTADVEADALLKRKTKSIWHYSKVTHKVEIVGRKIVGCLMAREG